MNQFDSIPDELRALPQWVNWVSEMRDRKPSKHPIDPKTGRGASVDKPATWGTFKEALTLDPEHIGFVFTQVDPYCGIDLDNCRDQKTGEVLQWAKDIAKKMSSYTEISPSGSGLHIIVKAKLPPGGNRKGNIELYDHSRFFCVTGDVYEAGDADD